MIGDADKKIRSANFQMYAFRACRIIFFACLSPMTAMILATHYLLVLVIKILSHR